LLQLIGEIIPSKAPRLLLARRRVVTHARGFSRLTPSPPGFPFLRDVETRGRGSRVIRVSCHVTAAINLTKCPCRIWTLNS